MFHLSVQDTGVTVVLIAVVASLKTSFFPSIRLLIRTTTICEIFLDTIVSITGELKNRGIRSDKLPLIILETTFLMKSSNLEPQQSNCNGFNFFSLA